MAGLGVMRAGRDAASDQAMLAPFMRLQEVVCRTVAEYCGHEPITFTSPYPAQIPRQSRLRRSVGALVLREMVTTYGRSPGGYLWAVLEPLAAIALLSFAFSLAFRAPSLGVSFPLFYATAYLPYMLFHDVSAKTASAIRFSRPLLNFSAVTWVDVLAARFLLNTFTHLVVGALVLGCMVVFLETRAILDGTGILLSVLMAAVLALGIGSLNAYLFLAFPAWERLWTIFTRPLFIISGVFFLFEDVPAELGDALWFNPLFHITGQMRASFYGTYDATYVVPLFPLAVGTACLLLGLLLLARHADGMIHK